MVTQKRIIFMGTPIFAAKVLDMLIEANYLVVGVISQPNRKTGRKRIETPTPVSVVAHEQDIPCIQPAVISEAVDWIAQLKPDLLLTCAYGQIVNQTILDIPTMGCLNLHASLLPKYRGGAPIQYALLNGDKKTGISLMQMVSRMDAGDVFATQEVEITLEDTQATLYQKLEGCAYLIINNSLKAYLENKLVGISQDETKVIYAPNIQREQERIDVYQDGMKVYNQIRALNPIPGAYLLYEGIKVKLFSVKIVKNTYEGIPMIKQADKKHLVITFKNYDLYVESLQVEGKKQMDYITFFAGNQSFFTIKKQVM